MSDAERVSWEHLKTRVPSEAEREALRVELVGRALAVARDGWEAHRGEWSDGEVAGVALLLGEAGVLEEVEEVEGSVLTRFAGQLYGFHGARKDIEAGLVGTQACFAAARAEVDTRGLDG
ncbi:hypothetical protein [Nocardia crassostreae]|uniref:hypothetical protein n=1 Tax=Nocardia crassostreae TaxID=53428 RepID=UPI000832C9F1|nr:hypothetical protein [Nocardia crassostreae]